MMVDLLPAGLRGLMLASFFAAFMSTLSTYLNLSSAYFVNDFYHPYVRKDATEKHLITISRIATLALSVVTAIVTYYVTSIIGLFKFLIAFGSGTGLVYIIRWYWWRVNAWSEISAMIASTVMTVLAYTHPLFKASPYYSKLVLIISISTVVWVFVTFLTKPSDNEKLIEFYKKTTPGGIGWKPIKRLMDDHPEGSPLKDAFIEWVYGCVFVVGLTLGIGKVLLGYYLSGSVYLSLSLIAGCLVYKRLSRHGWGEVYK